MIPDEWVSDKQEAMRTLMRKDFRSFVEMSLPPPPGSGKVSGYETGWFHAELMEALEQFTRDVLDGKRPHLMVSMPPRSGKSFIFSERYPVWGLGNYPWMEFVVTSYSADLSVQFSKSALDLARECIADRVFPALSLDESKQAMDNWRTTSGKGGYRSVGVGGSLTGSGANVLIVDDPFKDWEQACSETQREKVWNWFQSTAYTRLYPNSGVLVIMTRWHEDDLAGKLLAQEKENAEKGLPVMGWKEFKYQAIATSDGPDGVREPGEALHPERYPLPVLMQYKAALSEAIWEALYQQNPRPPGGRYIPADLFRIIGPSEARSIIYARECAMDPDSGVEVLKEHEYPPRTVRGWDLAVKAKKANDHTASAKMSVHHGVSKEDTVIFVWHMTVYRRNWSENKKIISEYAKKEGVTVVVEDSGQFDIAIRELRLEVKEKAPILACKVSADKLTRALPWIERVEKGCVFLVAPTDELAEKARTAGPRTDKGTLWIAKLLEQAKAFDPSQSKQEDDMVDALSIAYSTLRRRKSPKIYTGGD